MLIPYDLHIHSCLSPCGEEEMTPNNIVGMAQLLELGMIAVADHNTARQLPAIEQLAREAGVLLVPAIEVTTAEEAHVLSFFPMSRRHWRWGNCCTRRCPRSKTARISSGPR